MPLGSATSRYFSDLETGRRETPAITAVRAGASRTLQQYNSYIFCELLKPTRGCRRTRIGLFYECSCCFHSPHPRSIAAPVTSRRMAMRERIN